MANEERYIAVIEISSSKIIGAVAKTVGKGELDVIAVEQEKGVDSVRYGVIKNLEETAMRVGRVLERLQNKPTVLPRKITGVFVGLSGRSLRSITAEASIALPDDTEITEEILTRLRQEALSKRINTSLEVVDAIPRTFLVGGNPTSSPKGTIGNSVEAVYDLIVCRPELKRNLVKTITEKLGTEIKGIVVTALACGHLILSTDEKRLGCMLVDMGAETSTVTIYKEGHLEYFDTIPLGGRHITRDLTSLSLLEERAEDIKLTSGNALASENKSNLNFNGVKLADVSNLIVARSEEIVANIVEHISYAGLKEKDLPGGIICIGGGSNLNGMIDLLSNYSGMAVRKGKLPPYVKIDDVRATGNNLQVVSVLYAAATMSRESCLEIPRPQELPENEVVEEEVTPGEKERGKSKPPKSENTRGLMDKIRNKFTNFFAGSEDDDSDLLE